MKNIYILAITALAFTLNISAQTIKHNDSDEIIGGTVACPTEPTNYLRVFDLVNEFNITTDWTISGVSFGTEVSETADITINLYTADDVDPTGAILTLIYTGTEATTDLEISEHTLSAPVTIPAGSILVMELAESADGIVYRVGSNDAGQTAPSWLSSETCGAGTVEGFGFTNHYIMSVTGEEALGSDTNLSEVISVYPNPATDVLNIAIPSSIDVKSVSLFDVLGKKANVSLVNGQVDISELAVGLYLLNVETTNGTLTQKVIKQ
jgi:hypothetical protein